MTREEIFKKMKVTKGDHYCMFCDCDADFVIITNELKKEFPMCNICAELLKEKIKKGLNGDVC